MSTFTLCTIQSVLNAIPSIRRVLKPDGKFISSSTVCRPMLGFDAGRSGRNRFFIGSSKACHVTRDIPCLIQQGGFKIEQMDTGYLAPFSKSGSYCSWGVAVPIAHQIGHALYMGFATHPGNGARSEVASRQGPPKAAWKGTPRFSGQVEKLDIQLRLAPLLFGAPKHPWVRFEGA